LTVGDAACGHDASRLGASQNALDGHLHLKATMAQQIILGAKIGIALCFHLADRYDIVAGVGDHLARLINIERAACRSEEKTPCS